MTRVGLNGGAVLALAGLAGLAVLGLYVASKGSISKAAADAGRAAAGAAAQLAGGVVTGGVDAASQAAGLPTTFDTVTDPAQARYLIDRLGYFEASKWSGAPALFRAIAMDAGTGTPPPPNSPAGRMLAGLPDAYQEARLYRPVQRVYGQGGQVTDPTLYDPYSPFVSGA